MRASFCRLPDVIGETRSSLDEFCDAVGVSWKSRREDGWWKGLLLMLLVLVLVLSSMRTGCCMVWDVELDALRGGGDIDACLVVGARDDEAMIDGGDSSEISFMLWYKELDALGDALGW